MFNMWGGRERKESRITPMLWPDGEDFKRVEIF